MFGILKEMLPLYLERLEKPCMLDNVWLVGTKDGGIIVSVGEKPVRCGNVWTFPKSSRVLFRAETDLCPDVKWEDEPVEIEFGLQFDELRDKLNNSWKSAFNCLFGDLFDTLDTERKTAATEEKTVEKPAEKTDARKIEIEDAAKKPEKENPLTFESYGAHLRNMLGTYQFLVDIITELCKGNMNRDAFIRLVQDKDLQKGVYDLVQFSRDEKLEALNWRQPK